MKTVSIFIIRFYQACISPFLGNRCRFYPSCSQYSNDALNKYGFFRGLILTVQRVTKCHPFSTGGIDYVPERTK